MSSKEEKCGLCKHETPCPHSRLDNMMDKAFQSESIEWEKEFVESGASIEHDRWARWQKYMFSKGTVDENGVFHLPKEFVERWFRQIDTKYADLSEPEKESDRKESRTYIPLVKQAITAAVAKRDAYLVEEAEKEKCNGTKAEWLLEFENMVKDNSFVTPSSHLNVLAIQDFISKSITTAVAKRDAYLVEEIEKSARYQSSARATVDIVLSIIKH